MLVRQLIADKTPDRLEMPNALWSHAAVGQLIEQCFGIRLTVRTEGLLYLSRWAAACERTRRYFGAILTFVRNTFSGSNFALSSRSRA